MNRFKQLGLGFFLGLIALTVIAATITDNNFLSTQFGYTGGKVFVKGGGLTNLNASQLLAGTIPAARLPLLTNTTVYGTLSILQIDEAEPLQWGYLKLYGYDLDGPVYIHQDDTAEGMVITFGSDSTNFVGTAIQGSLYIGSGVKLSDEGGGGTTLITPNNLTVGGVFSLGGEVEFRTDTSDNESFTIGRGNTIDAAATVLHVLGVNNIVSAPVGVSTVGIFGFGNTITNGSNAMIIGHNNVVDTAIDLFAFGNANYVLGDKDERLAIGLYNYPSETTTMSVGFYLTNVVPNSVEIGANNATKLSLSTTGAVFRVPITGDGSGLTNLSVSGGTGSSNIVDVGYVAVARNLTVTTNLIVGGGITAGTGSSVAGGFFFNEGTAPSLVANQFGIYAPADVAAGGLALVLPGAAFSGPMKTVNAGGVMTLSAATFADIQALAPSAIITNSFAGTIAATTFSGAAGGVTLDASGFNGNLATTDNTLQEVAQKLDDLTGGSGFPLTADANFGGFSGTNASALVATNKLAIGTNNVPAGFTAYIKSPVLEGNTNYVGVNTNGDFVIRGNGTNGFDNAWVTNWANIRTNNGALDPSTNFISTLATEVTNSARRAELKLIVEFNEVATGTAQLSIRLVENGMTNTFPYTAPGGVVLSITNTIDVGIIGPSCRVLATDTSYGTGASVRINASRLLGL